MASRLDEFVRETIDEMLKELPPKKRWEGLTPEERLEGLTLEERLEGLTLEERLEGLSPDELRAALEAVQRRLQSHSPSVKLR